MPLNTRLNKNVTVSKFLDLIKEADDGGHLKSVEYVQLEQILSENLPKQNFLNRLINKLITDSTNFTLNELDRYNSIADEQDDAHQTDYEESDAKIEQLEQHLNLIKDQKELLECELMKLYNYDLDDELSKEREQLNQFKLKLRVLFDDFKPLLSKRTLETTTKLDRQLFSRLDKLKEKKLQINELIEEIIMHVDLNLNRDKLVKIIEREYCLKLIQIKNVLEALKNETELILKIHHNKLIKNTIWKVYLKDFKDEINNEVTLISSAKQDKNVDHEASNTTDSFDFEEFKQYLELSKNDQLDELLSIAKQAFKKINN